MQIQPYDPQHIDAIIRLSLRAWAPVFDSIQNAMDGNVYGELHPDWRANQQRAVEEVCDSQDIHVWVAVEGAATVGFVAVRLQPASKMGEST